MKIGEVAVRAGVSVDTLRFYEVSSDMLRGLFAEKIALLDERIGQMHALRNLLAERAGQVCPLVGAGAADVP